MSDEVGVAYVVAFESRDAAQELIGQALGRSGLLRNAGDRFAAADAALAALDERTRSIPSLLLSLRVDDLHAHV